MKCKCGHNMRLNSKNFVGTENTDEYCADCALVIMALQGEAEAKQKVEDAKEERYIAEMEEDEEDDYDDYDDYDEEDCGDGGCCEFCGEPYSDGCGCGELDFD